MMRWKMANRTPHLLIVQLNSGKSVHLAPNEISPFLDHREINGNAKVDKLLASNSITLVQEKIQAAAPVAQFEALRRATEPAEHDEHKSKREQEAEREPEREREPKRELKKK